MATETSVNTQFKGRIGVTLIAIFVALAVLPAVALVSFATFQVSEQAEDTALERMRSQVQIKTNDVKRWLAGARTNISLILANTDEQERMVSILASDRQQTTATNLQAAFLQDQLAVQDTFSEFFLYNRDGVVRVSTDAEAIGQDISNSPFLEQGLTSDSIFAPYFDPARASLQMLMLVPLQDENGEVVGAFAGRLRLDVLSEIMTTRVGLGDTGETYLITSNNGLLVTPSRFDGYLVGRLYESDAILQALDGQDGDGVYENYFGEDVIGVYRWLPETQMAVLAEIQQDEVLGVINNTQLLVIAVGFGIALLAVMIGIGVTAWITRPIMTLTRTAARVIYGDYSQRTPITRRNEIGQLTASFNLMTDRLVENISELDDRVDEIRETNKQLRVATAKAREASRIKGEFLATMSHELRTPLNAIIGFSDMLLMGMSGPLNEKQTHRLTRLQENGKRLLTLINDILDVTRIEAGRMELDPKPFSPSALCERVSGQMKVLADNKNLTFDVHIADDLPETIVSDEPRIEQTLVNLLSNAFKFTERGTVTLTVSCQPDDETWTVQVRDTGVGIPPHATELIFDEFRQVDGTSRRSFGGTGLGLSITRNLVRLLGGQIVVDSTLGEGSTFTITYPITFPEPVALEEI